MKFSLTKLAGSGMILSGIGQIIMERSLSQEAIQLVVTGLAVIGGRNAIDKIGK